MEEDSSEPAMCYLHPIETEMGIQTILEVPNALPDFNETNKMENKTILNIVMADVSGSMSSFWSDVESGWNEHVSSYLTGNTKMFVFGTEIDYLRNDVEFKEGDFKCTGTDLTGAIERIRQEIEKAIESFVRVFLITDGHHNATSTTPSVEIEKLYIPPGKTVEVFLFGLGTAFPVEYSITIRSKLHNGNSNVPSIFWAKSSEEITNEFLSIADIVKRTIVDIHLSEPGLLCPEFPETTLVHTSEFVLLKRVPRKIKENLKLFVKNSEGDMIEIPCKYIIKQMNERFLLDKVFRQWNSLIIQAHHRKEKIPEKVFDIIENIYTIQHKKLNSEVLHTIAAAPKSIYSRLRMKDLKHVENEFANLMNQSKKVIGLEGKYQSEIELAESILKTTVKSKYALKTLNMKGHSSEAYEGDLEKFKQIYEELKSDILNLPEPLHEECCNVTFQSTVLDLKDDGFHELMELDKYNFMKCFTLPGIPIYSPIQDAAQINPWALCIKTILVAPYALVSQTALEFSASMGTATINKENKDVYLSAADESSRFNAVIPVFNEEVCKVLKPLLRSNIFGILSTFCILKNANIIDMNAHLAALACAFVKSITDFPIENRPEFIEHRLKLIYFTSKVYEDRKGFATYFEVLMNNPTKALITETKQVSEEIPIKCESLLKPCIFLYMHRNQESVVSKKKMIIKMITVEFFGRCLSKYYEATPFLDYFVAELSTKEKREEWIQKKASETDGTLNKFVMQHGSLLKTYFTLEELKKQIQIFTKEEFVDNTVSFFDITPVSKKIEKLFNPSSAGSISFAGLKAFGREMELSAEDIDDIFSVDNILIYLVHALLHKSSQDRMETELLPYDESLKVVKDHIAKEQNQLMAMLGEQVIKRAEEKYVEEYRDVHDNNFVKPTTPDEIIKMASERGVHVTSSNFEKVFKYKKTTGLIRNCCMIQSCPHFLKPNQSFNQHIWIERKHSNRSHLVHKVTSNFALEENAFDEILNHLLNGNSRGTNGRKTIPAPSREEIFEIKPEIEKLLLEYANLLTNDEPDMVSQQEA